MAECNEPTPDALLLVAARNGDRSAFGELYDRYSSAAYSLALHLVGEATASDVVQDCFVGLLTRPDTFDPGRGSFRGWFMTSVHHRSITVLRSRRPSVGEEALAEIPDPERDPAEKVIRNLQDSAVREALLQIPQAQREVLVLAYYGGLSQSDLSRRMGVPLGTVKARMRRGLLALRGLVRGEAAPPTDEEAGS
jgi:RNA polymerase sigma factor (sigma-70 family)